MYYTIQILLQILIEIGLLLWEYKFTISMPVICAICWAIGKRHGVKFAVNYIMKTFGLEMKSKLEQQIEHHEREIIKMGGTPWAESGDTKKSWMVQTTLLKKRSLLSLVAIHRKGKWKMKDFLTGKKKWLAFLLAVLINGLNETLGLGIDADTVSNITTGATGYIVVEGVLDFTRSITNHLKAKGETKNAELNIPIEPPL